MQVKMMGNDMMLEGQIPKLGEVMPSAKLLDNELKEVSTDSFRGKVLLIATVPSLDTPVCDAEAHRFNKEAASLGSDIQILVVSMDLPFAQARWCGAAGIDKVKTLSDHRYADFGEKFGVLIPALRLLARAIFVADRDGRLIYMQIVPEVTNHPNYDGALDAVKKLI
ncbi:MAG TPA: thiol peroxidase [Phycisphaerae bacterium]|nr:thiol peroxidase [Phycisphaerae bacterium]